MAEFVRSWGGSLTILDAELCIKPIDLLLSIGDFEVYWWSSALRLMGIVLMRILLRSGETRYSNTVTLVAPTFSASLERARN